MICNLIKFDFSGSHAACLLGNIMTLSLLNLSIDKKTLNELFNVLLHHCSHKSKGLK